MRSRVLAYSVVVPVFTLVVACSSSDTASSPQTTMSTSDALAASVTPAAPTAPPAAICGNSSVLSGPSTAPAGAVTVRTTDHLDEVVDRYPAGTTFWLAPGKHTLRSGEYAQVEPKDGDVFIGAPGAVIDGRHDNKYAFGGDAKNVVIRYLTIQNFGVPKGNGDEGVVNHNAADGWLVEYDTIKLNAGAGVFLGNNDIVRYSCLQDNGQYGFSAYRVEGVSNLTLDHNEISGNNTDEWEKVPGKPDEESGCGCSGGGKFWEVKGATITNNYVHDNRSMGFWADTNNVDFVFQGNYIANNRSSGLMYEISYNATIKQNTFVRNGLEEGPTTDFPTGAIYISEAGGDARVSSRSTLDIAENVFTDNWSGVILFENADRFCNSPANTSSGDCTVGGAATLRTCVKGTIEKEPYKSDCRWKTKNVAVHDNKFQLTPSNVPGCAGNQLCGLQGLLSNYGTYPDWSPYKGDQVQQAVTFNQNNVFARNEYVGPWRVMAHDQDRIIDLATWQKAPYNQDSGSTRR